MIAYATNELISSSEISKKFGSYLSQVTTCTVDKLAILRNNKVEAVMVSKDEYERMKEALEFAEHEEIYAMIQKLNIDPDDLVSDKN
jgi:PHD/YefM family antitoxin component YafN of YafNO toxin-antitoxin module